MKINYNEILNKNMINVFGGKQLRPNLHILDYCEVVELLINSPNQIIKNQIFNVGYQNLSVEKIANTVKKITLKFLNKKIKIPIIKTKTNDNRSYHINSDKIYNVLNYKPKRNIELAIIELLKKFKQKKHRKYILDEFGVLLFDVLTY